MGHRTLLRFVTVGLLAFGVIAGTAGPAAAHANLLSTEPEYGAALPAGPDRILLRYDLPVELTGAQVKLERSGQPVRVRRPVYASPDRKDVSLPLPKLGNGSYLLTWFLFGSDGDVMGGELAFRILLPGAPAESGSGADVRPGASVTTPAAAPSSPAPAPRTRPATRRTFAPLSEAQDAARLMGFASMAVLIGGVTFVALLWPAGARLHRTRALLWGALAGALVATAADLGLKGAAVSGQSALGVFSPAALSALNGTHVGRVLLARLGFLLLAAPMVSCLTVAPWLALRSRRWVLGAAASGLGALATHGVLSHAYARGPLAAATNVVHLAAVTVWLGGLVVLAVVVLPRRRADELYLVVPRWSRFAFASVATAAVAGTVVLVLISPRWTALPNSEYGRFLLLKLGLVVLLLTVASRARDFVRRCLPELTTPAVLDLTAVESPAEHPIPVGIGAGLSRPAAMAPRMTHGPRRASENVMVDVVSLRPFVSAVTAELCIAASILAATAVLVGRPPPT
jgi:copper transport protein